MERAAKNIPGPSRAAVAVGATSPSVSLLPIRTSEGPW